MQEHFWLKFNIDFVSHVKFLKTELY